VTFSLTGAGGATTTGAGVGATGAAAGAGAGAGTGAGAGGFKAPSQSLLAVAGVQFESRQQRVPSPLFTGIPVELTQLSAPVGVVCASTDDTEAASIAEAKSDATLFSFFMILLLRKGADVLHITTQPETIKPDRKVLVNTTNKVHLPPTRDCAIGYSANRHLVR